MLINELVTKLTFKQDNGLAAYERSLQGAKKSSKSAAEAIERNMTGAAATIHKMLKFNVQVKTNRAHMQVKALEAAFGGLKSIAMAGFGIAGLGAAGAGAVGKQILDVGKNYERLQAALTTATGSEAKGAQAFKEIELFAKKTPYDLNQVAEAFIKLKNMGLDPSQAALTSYGNTAGAMGKDLNQMIEAVADAATGEFERLKEFGIKSKQQGDNVTFTFRGVNTTVKKDAKEIQKYLLDLGNTQFAGGMDRQSKTIGGMTSTLSDNFQALGRAIWTGGFGDAAKSVVKWLTEFTDKIQPIVEKQVPIFMKDMQKLSINVLPKVVPLLEGMVSALVGMGTAYGVMQGMALAKWFGSMIMAWRAMDGAMKAAAISGAIANLTIAWIPMLIAAAVAAVAWFGWQVYKYITQGTDSLTWMNENFKWVADSIMFVGELIKTWWPIIEYTAKVIAGVLILAFQGLWTMIQFNWDTIVKPVFDHFVQSLTDIWNWIQSVTTGSSDWNAGIAVLWENWKGFLEWLKPALDAVSNIVNTIGSAMSSWGNALAGLTGGGGGDPSAAGTGLPEGFSKNGKMANNLVAMSHQIKTLRKNGGDCLQVVYRIQQAALNGTSKITALHAADAAQQMAGDKRFREIKVTKAMLSDPNYKAMLHGAQVFYNRSAGFSPLSGHAESWDMSGAGSANFGTGAVPLSRRSEHNLQNARVFIPVNSGGAPVINNTININGSNATPQRIQTAVTNGTGQALNKAGKQTRKVVTPTTVVLG